MDEKKDEALDECIKEIAKNSNDIVNRNISQILISNEGQELDEGSYQKILNYSWNKYKPQENEDE